MSLVEIATATEATALAVPFSVRLAARHSAAAAAVREEAMRREAALRERRAYTRRPASELTWLKGARLMHGPGVSLVDLSEGGALLDADVPLKPGAHLVLELEGEGSRLEVPLSVLRSHVARLHGALMIYRGACAFKAPVDLGRMLAAPAQRLPGEVFAGVDVALAHLLNRVEQAAADSSRTATAIESLDPDKVLHVLESLQVRLRTSSGDTYQRGVADLLARVLPEVRRGTPPDAVSAMVEERIGGLQPQGQRTGRSLTIHAPGSPHRLAHTGELLKELVRRLHAHPVDTIPVSEPAPPSTFSPPDRATAWQKIVVRYRDGRLLKGFTQDFHPSRGHFSLWPSITAARGERVVVPFARLKAVFFVRDFNGNAAYVEREGGQTQAGRRVEVTFADNEVVRGTTLNYSPDGVGFFVVPLDPRSNNQRIFVVGTALRHVRFPDR